MSNLNEVNANHIVQSLWIGDSLTQIEQLCIRSYQANDHEFHLYVYDEIEGIPDNTVIKNADEIISRSKIFIDSRGSIASFSDWFRYKLLFEKGGWWVDMDNVCLKPYDFEQEYCFSSEGRNVFTGELNNGIMKSKSNSDFLSDCLTFIESQPNLNNVEWGEFGPKLLKKILEDYDCEEFVCPPYTFCPIHYSNFSDVFLKNFTLIDQVYSIHLWNEMLRTHNVPKNSQFSADSLFESLKRKYFR